MAYKQKSAQVVSEGGTGVGSNTVYAVLCGGTTATGAIQSIASVGTATQQLTSNGAAALPTFQAAGAAAITGPVSSTDNAAARWNGTGGDTLQDSSVIMSDNGEMTNASQPAFAAYLATADNDVTGNNVTFFLGNTDVGTTLTEIFDQNADFTPGASGGAVFAAPVTGIYCVSAGVCFSGVVSTQVNGRKTLVTSNRSYQANTYNEFKYVDAGTISVSTPMILGDLDAADTFKASTRVNLGSQLVDVLGLSTAIKRTTMSGYLAC